MVLHGRVAPLLRRPAGTTRRAGAALVLGCLSAALVAGCGDCAIRDVAVATAPGGLHRATVTAQSCGGSIGGTAVTIRVMRVLHEAPGAGGEVEVFAANRWVDPQIRWDGPSTLLVEYRDPDGRRHGSSVLRARSEPWDGLRFVLRDNAP
jgi:hypothetical protein